MEQKETCSFCGKDVDEVELLINGPGNHLYICNECIEDCMEMWRDFQEDKKE